MTNLYLGKLLHLCDTTLPIGGYTHSNGLETYVQKGLVKDPASTELFVRNMIANNILYNDAAFLRLAYEAAAAADTSAIEALDRECAALKAPAEIKQASVKLGTRLFKIFDRQTSSPSIDAYRTVIESGDAAGQYPIVFGLYAHHFGIPLRDAVYAFCYNAAASMVTNAVKLIPLSQLAGQDILYRMQDIIADTTERVLCLDRSSVGLCNIGFDIRCMQHERLYSRLYMS